MRVSFIDATAEVQSLYKPQWIRSCSHCEDRHTCRIFERYGESEEIRLIFDRYDHPLSPEEATRRKLREPASSLLPHNALNAYHQGHNEEAAFPCQHKERAGRISCAKDPRACRAKWNPDGGGVRL